MIWEKLLLAARRSLHRGFVPESDGSCLANGRPVSTIAGLCLGAARRVLWSAPPRIQNWLPVNPRLIHLHRNIQSWRPQRPSFHQVQRWLGWLLDNTPEVA